MAVEQSTEMVCNRFVEESTQKDIRQASLSGSNFFFMMGMVDKDSKGNQTYSPVATAIFEKDDTDDSRMIYDVVFLATSSKRWVRTAANADGMGFEKRGSASLLLTCLREMAETENGCEGVLRVRCTSTGLCEWYSNLGFMSDDDHQNIIAPTQASLAQKRYSSYNFITKSRALGIPSHLAGCRVLSSNHIHIRRCCKNKLLQYCGAKDGSEACEMVLRYFSFFQDRVPSTGLCHDENEDRYCLRCDICDEVMAGAPIEGLPQCIISFVLTHGKRCKAIRDALAKLQRHNGNVKKQFEKEESFMLHMVWKYICVIRKSSCTIGCGHYEDYPVINFRKATARVVIASHKADILDDDQFAEDREWAASLKVDPEEAEPVWPQVSHLARTSVPISCIAGPHWYARDIHGHVTHHRQDEIIGIFSDTYCMYCTKRPNQYINVWEGKARTRSQCKSEENTNNTVVYLTHVALFVQIHRHSCVMSSFASAFKYIGRHDIAQHLCKYIVESVAYLGSRVVFATNCVRNKLFGLQCVATRGVLFKDIQSDWGYPILLQLQGSDNAVDHCITVCCEIIFDSTFNHPMQFSKDALDICCRGSNNSNITSTRCIKHIVFSAREQKK